jgi:hypothetical protein
MQLKDMLNGNWRNNKMARGSKAKDVVANKLAKAFGNDWVGEYNKKYYVWADDGGERVQIAIALTCPKEFVEADATTFSQSSGGVLNFETMNTTIEPALVTELTQKEIDNIARLKKEFNL